MSATLFRNIFKTFIERNPFIFKDSLINNNPINANYNPNSNEVITMNTILDKDKEYFINVINELKNPKIKASIANIYTLLINECININNNITQKKAIALTLRKYLCNVVQEIKEQFLTSLEDKTMNISITKTQRYKMNKRNLRNTIKLLFFILVMVINKYKNIIDNTFHGYVIKGINMEYLPSNEIKGELFFLVIIQQNLFWIEIIIETILAIFQIFKNNKFRLLLNADTEFNNLDDNFKLSCFNCFLYLFNIIKKYSSIKLNTNDSNNIISAIYINEYSLYDNDILPIKIKNIDNCVFKLFECFIYEFLYDIDSLWKYFDNMNINLNYEKLYSFGIYLCEFIKLIAFTRDENLSKIDFFNFYIFSYNLVTNYFSKLNKYLYLAFTDISNVIKLKYILICSNFNLNYLQNLSNSLKDMLFNFMIFSYNNDTLKDAYSYNEILINPIISHCLLKTVLSIYPLLINCPNNNFIIDIMNIFIDNVAKYKLILPLKCHFHKELMTHNYLLILDEFLVNYEDEIVNKFNEIYNKGKRYSECINKLINKFNDSLSCLFNHYNFLNFIYSNHIMYLFNQILIRAGIPSRYSYTSVSNIFLRYIYSDKNYLNYKDIPLSKINSNEKENSNFNTEIKHKNRIKIFDLVNEYNLDNLTYYNDINISNENVTNIGFNLDENFDKNSAQLFDNIDIDDYEFKKSGKKYYLMKKIGGKNYSNIFVRNDGFVEKLGVDENLKENILNIMENIQYSDKNVYKLIQEKILNPSNSNIIISEYFYENIKYYDLKFEMDFFEYQNKIKELLI